ncbi:MAG: carbon-phosphorus lyase complex subunit PhnI [Spirochaetales bacterium]|nr:carbon-phosphorus lyase complex subunit PhnI [Spirochaetales bacterium]
MAYIAVKGGREAIDASREALKYDRVKGGVTPDAALVESSLGALVDQVMSESSLYSESTAALAIKQAQGSPEEAVFLMRAFRSTLPRKHYTAEVKTEEMRVIRRISAAFKDIPGGQVLGTSSDYTHRLLDYHLIKEDREELKEWLEEYLGGEIEPAKVKKYPKVIDYIRREGLLREVLSREEEPADVTKRSLQFPSRRSERLQILTRGQTGAVTALGYAGLRGYGVLHPTVGELRVGHIALEIPNPYGDSDDEGENYYLGEIRITEVESLIPVSTPKGQGRAEVEFEVGYGICYGQNETKAIAMSILDQALETDEVQFPIQDEEFVLMHIDSVEATGFISHLKLPHYVTFQAKLDSLRKEGKERENEKQDQ